MALTKLTKDMDIIQKLGDEPNDVDGMTSAELKAKFDEGNNAMKQWVNDTFIPEVEKEIKASRLENLPEHAHTHAKDGRDPITPESIGARPDTWLPTIDEIGAAPAGYGLGFAQTITWDEIDATTRPGWYCIEGRNTIDGVSANYWYIVVSAYTDGGRHCTQRLRPVHLSCDIVRHKYNQDWGPFEWENPPMQLGVEYRTTERYMGKPVYKKLVNFGSLPGANAIATVAHGIENIRWIVSVNAMRHDTTDTDVTIPFPSGDPAGLTVCYADPTNIYIRTMSDTGYAHRQAYVLMKYTKHTD